MKTYFKQVFSAILAVGIIFSSCSKDVETPIAQTTLQVNVKTSIGSPLAGAKVEIYSNLSDYTNRTNAVSIKVADYLGVVVFDKGILPIVYYVHAEDGGCKANYLGATKTFLLTANKNNSFNTTVDSFGKLTFSNYSIYPYKVYVNGKVAIESLQGLTSKSLYALAGNYTIRIVQLSGYVTTPIDKTSVGSMSCGGDFITRFP